MIQPSAEEFLRACGAQAPPLLEIEPPGQGKIVRRTLALPFVRIGRDEHADVCLEDKDISRRHTYLQMAAGRWWWVDLDSRTGTRATGETAASVGDLSSSGPLHNRKGICIGPYTIQLAGEGPNGKGNSTVPANPLTREADDPPSLPRLALDIGSGAAQPMTWRVDRPLTLLGRRSLCKVRLRSPGVSRTHCALLNTAAGPWVVDLLSRNGTIVNGEAVPWARLEPEDELQIGPFRIRVRFLTPSPHPFTVTTYGQFAPEERRLTRNESEKVASLGSALCVNPRLSAVDSFPPTISLPMNANEALLLPLMTQFSLMQQQMFDQFQHTLLMMAQTFSNLHEEQLALVRQELEQIQELSRQLHTLQAEEKQQTSLLLPPPPETPPPPRSSVPPMAAVAKAATVPPIAAHSSGEVHVWLSQRLAAIQQERQNRWQKILTFVKGK